LVLSIREFSPVRKISYGILFAKGQFSMPSKTPPKLRYFAFFRGVCGIPHKTLQNRATGLLNALQRVLKAILLFACFFVLAIF